MDHVIFWFGCALIPLFWFLQNVIHESSHVLIPKLKGCEVKIYPYPKKDPEGRWHWALSSWRCSTLVSPTTRLFISAMPRVVNLLVIGIVAAVRPASNWVNTALVVWQASAFVDFAVNTLGVFYPEDRPNDAWRTAHAAGLTNKVAVRIGSVLVVLVVGAVVLRTMFR